jgi:hypothetical protein
MKNRVALIAAAAIGCVVRQPMGGLAIVTSKPLPVQLEELGSAVAGEACAWGRTPSLEAAIDDAAAKVSGGNALANVTVSEEAVLIFPLVRNCLRVSGQVVLVKEDAETAARRETSARAEREYQALRQSLDSDSIRSKMLDACTEETRPHIDMAIACYRRREEALERHGPPDERRKDPI